MPRPPKDTASEVAETIKSLSINTNPPKVAMRSARPAKDSAVAESWDEEEGVDGDDQFTGNVPTPTATPSLSRAGTFDSPGAPPPTPSSPVAVSKSPLYDQQYQENPYDFSEQDPSQSQQSADKRPEKSTAVANRLIAGALGVRAPKRTEEQRQYDRAIKEQEIRRKNKEKDEASRRLEEAEKAKAAIWDD